MGGSSRGGDYPREDPEGSRFGGEGSGEGSMGRADVDFSHVPRPRPEPNNRQEAPQQDAAPGAACSGGVLAAQTVADGGANINFDDPVAQPAGVFAPPQSADDVSP